MKNQPTIVIAAWDRPHALQGLLDSLLSAEYLGSARLVISIDGGGHAAVIAIAEQLLWPYGEKTIIKHPTRLGLKAHILECGGLTAQYGSIILLEDDLEVARGFYQFSVDTLKAYENEALIAGISLYSYQIKESDYYPFAPYLDGLDAYLMQFPSSWGQAWTAKQWQGFEAWLKSHSQADNQLLPVYVQRWGKQSWKKLCVQYLLEKQLYFVYPKVSFTTNKGYAGTHFALQLSLFEVILHDGQPLSPPPINTMLRYHVGFEIESGLPKDPLDKTAPVNVAQAEYVWRVTNRRVPASLLGKWLFVGRYNVYNWLKAILNRL